MYKRVKTQKIQSPQVSNYFQFQCYNRSSFVIFLTTFTCDSYHLIRNQQLHFISFRSCLSSEGGLESIFVSIIYREKRWMHKTCVSRILIFYCQLLDWNCSAFKCNLIIMKSTYSLFQMAFTKLNSSSRLIVTLSASSNTVYARLEAAEST